MRAMSTLMFLAALAAPAGAGLFRVWVNQDSVQMGYALSEATAERRRLQDQLHELEVELAAETSPEQLSRLARRLGLQPPTANQILGIKGRSAP